jgi:hypothetical protein
MVPPREAFRPRPKNWTMPDFGYLSNRTASRWSTLPNLKPIELAEAGRVGGYKGGLVDGCGGLCSPGLLNLSTEVHVFRTAAQASRFFADRTTGYPAPGHRGRYGKLLSVEPFDSAGFGEEAAGVRAEADACCSETITETVILFRVGQVVGLSSAVNLNRNGRPGTYPNGRAAALAAVLARNIEAVLAARQ